MCFRLLHKITRSKTCKQAVSIGALYCASVRSAFSYQNKTPGAARTDDELISSGGGHHRLPPTDKLLSPTETVPPVTAGGSTLPSTAGLEQRGQEILFSLSFSLHGALFELLQLLKFHRVRSCRPEDWHSLTDSLPSPLLFTGQF